MAQVSQFLDKFSRDRRYSIPLPFQWTVTLTEGGVVGAINTAVGKLGENWKITSSRSWTGDNNILVAQEVTLPGEMVETISLGPDNRGAFMPGQGIVQRSDFLQRPVIVNFLETESDISTELFRPWTIALAVDGLLNTQLRATAMNITQYTRDMKKRKEYKFESIFPTNVEGYTLSYGDQEFQVTSVSFAYKNYTVSV